LGLIELPLVVLSVRPEKSIADPGAARAISPVRATVFHAGQPFIVL
jgi:hypothetical protein